MSRQKALDPNTDPEVLCDIAGEYPDEVLANPVMPLLLLEDPSGLWARITGRAKSVQATRALNKIILRMPDEHRGVFAAACLRRALPVLEATRPWAKTVISYLHAIARELEDWSVAGDRGRQEIQDRLAALAYQVTMARFSSKVLDCGRDAANVIVALDQSDGMTRRAARHSAEAIASAQGGEDSGLYAMAYAQEAWAQVELAARIDG